ncbi:MAG: hypothetical protein K6F82_00135 [Sphaerochaetaceae bacterium]|nr:hypothetical protein [Sphaerochaetaceae bacterium]
MKHHAIKKAVVILLLSILIPCIYAQSYQTYAESAAFSNVRFQKNKIVFVTACFDTFSWNRAAENLIRDELEKNGIEVKVMTDYADASQYIYDETASLPELPLEAYADYSMAVFPSDIYTYTYGGGISQAGFIVTVISPNGNCRIELQTEADTNDMLSLNATKGPVLESMAKALVQEYLKYVKEGF